jgi:polyisoprenoid-binding protein YceI
MISRTAIARIAAVLAGMLAFCSASAGEIYEVDPSHSDVIFKVRHLVSTVTGHFREFSGKIVVDRENLANSSVSFSIKTASIDTASDRRDRHLRSAEFFDVEKFPEITFVSTAITRSAGDTYDVRGRFTMHGVTKEIALPVEILGFTSHERFGERAGFSSALTLDRTEYGITYNMPLDADTLVLGEEVRIEINIEAAKP